ncbi:hypothetical protein LEP1GSC137_1739 [Leptospira borgpetersenii str. Noumea 25]|nr:hypothetical protein LEP1GSC137_1739 [Leptospira borgpetersenii str. Noumea 25]
MNLQILFIGVFAIIALIVSSFCGFFIGNNFGHIILVTIPSMIAFAVFGFGVHAFLEKKSPSFWIFFPILGKGSLLPLPIRKASEGGMIIQVMQVILNFHRVMSRLPIRKYLRQRLRNLRKTVISAIILWSKI